MANRSIIPEIEAEYGKPIREILIDLYEKHRSISGVAEQIGVSTSAIQYWLLKEGLEIRSILVEAER